jgi:hypothetical protein
MTDHKNDDLMNEAVYAAEATDTCHLCGQPSAPVENGVHTNCAQREQFLADRS